jgi:hypothetical protein
MKLRHLPIMPSRIGIRNMNNPKTGASKPSWSLGRRSAFLSSFGLTIKNQRKIGQSTDFLKKF